MVRRLARLRLEDEGVEMVCGDVIAMSSVEVDHVFVAVLLDISIRLFG